MRVAILQFLGTNCEYDMQQACNLLSIPTSLVWYMQSQLPKDTTCVIIPGGFSYGDYLRSGAIARFAPIMKAVIAFAKEGGFVLGVCNGFQILLEAGLLPGAMRRNANLRFVSKPALLQVVSTNNALLQSFQKNDEICIPIAHAEGNYYINKEGLEDLKAHDQILLRYEENLNGSVNNIAGITNKERNIFGLMPHPERAVCHDIGGCDGLRMLEGFLRA